MENIWLKILKIKFSKPWMQEIWMILFNLIHYYICKDHNPNQKTHAAAQKTPFTNWIFSLKTQNCKFTSRAIQGIITVSLASSSITERFPITNAHQNLRNRYTEFNMFHEKCTFVFWFAGILITFYSLIHIPYALLKLTHVFNYVFMPCTRLYHYWILGFTGP